MNLILYILKKNRRTTMRKVQRVFYNYNTLICNSANENTSLVHPKRSKTIVKTIDVNTLTRDNIIYYKYIISDISYILISFSNFIKKDYNYYNRFFTSFYRILKKHSKKIKIKNQSKKINKLFILNIISYKDFIISICKKYNDTFYLWEINKNLFLNNNNNKIEKQKIKKNIKILIDDFHVFIKNEFTKLINKC